MMKTFFRDVRKSKVLLLMMLPGMIYYICFKYLPMFGIMIAFKNYNARKGFFGSDWVGIKNFEFLFRTEDAFVITRNTLCYNLAFIFIGICASVALAIIFDMLGRSKINKINQTVVLFPHFISWVVATYFVNMLLSSDKGVINNFILSITGNKGPDWYSEPKFWPIILMFCYLWKHIGYNSVIYYATIRGFDTELYEAARIDGATWIQEIRYITAPLLRPVIITMMTVAIGSVFYSDFGLFYLIPKNSGPLYPVTSTVDTYVYNGLLGGGHLGMSSAAGLYQSVVGFMFVLISNAIVKKLSPDDSMF